jgi:hypothetical protein
VGVLYSPQGLSADESVSATRWDWGASVGNSATESHYNFSIMAALFRDARQRWTQHIDALARGEEGTDKVRELRSE